MTSILDGVPTNQIYFRMGTTQGLFLPSLVYIGRLVSEKKCKVDKKQNICQRAPHHALMNEI